MPYQFVIPGRLPNLNDMIDAARANRYASAEMKKANTELVAWCVKRAKIPKMKRATLNITWYEISVRRDPDNVQAAVKFVWDGLVAAGVLTNDGWKQQGPVTHEMAVDKENPRVEVEVREVEACET